VARILVVDDSKTVEHALRKLLEPDGHTVEVLAAFVQLSAYLRATPPDLVVLDLSMPAMSGMAFGRFLRRQRGGNVPILIYSGRSKEEIRSAAEALGAAGYVQKGEEPKHVRATIERLLREARAGEGSDP